MVVARAVELRQHKAYGRRGAGLGRDLRHGGAARAAQVLVEHVGQDLVVGVGVDGGHEPMHDADLLVQHLRQRRQAIGRA